MLEEMINRIADLGHKEKAVQVLHPQQEPGHVYYLVGPDGIAKKVEADPAPRAHQPLSLETIAALAARFPSEVWYSRSGVTVFMDRERRNFAKMALNLSVPIRFLMDLEKKPTSFNQATLLRMLRVTLSNCLSLAPHLPETLKRVKFRSLREADSTVSHAKASLGKSIEQELTGTAAIPEQVKLCVPVWENLTAPGIEMKCALEVDLETESFQLIPLPGEIERVFEQAEDWLEGAITEELEHQGIEPEKVPVYRGIP